jgi:hypothetical protein
MNREDVILEVYRTIRGSINPSIIYADRDANKVIYCTRMHKVTLSFRVKIEERHNKLV